MVNLYKLKTGSNGGIIMEVLKYIVYALDVIVCLSLIVLVLMQSKNDSGASATVMGASANNFYEKNKGRTKEGKLKKATTILMIAFAVLTIALSVLYVVLLVSTRPYSVNNTYKLNKRSYNEFLGKIN